MKKFVHIVFGMALLIIAVGYSHNSTAEESKVHVIFQLDGATRDKETGDIIPLVEEFLYTMPDTTCIGFFFRRLDTIDNKTVRRSVIEAIPGSQFLISVGMADLSLNFSLDENNRDFIRQRIGKIQGWHETAWFGPFTIPDTVDINEGYIIKIPTVELERIPDSLSIKNPANPYVEKSEPYIKNLKYVDSIRQLNFKYEFEGGEVHRCD